MALEHQAIKVERLALEPVGARPDLDHGRQHREFVIRREHLQAQALIDRHREQVVDHRKTLALPAAFPVFLVIHPAKIDQLLELQAGVVAQPGGCLRQVFRGDLDGNFTDMRRQRLQAVGEYILHLLGEVFEAGHDGRAMVLVRLILFCN